MITKNLLLTGVLLAAVSGAAEPLSSSPATMNDTTTKMEAAAVLTADEIRDAQTALNDEIDAGLTVDGKLGAQTRKAIRHYQSDHGLTVTGTFDAATLDELGLDTGDRAPASTDQVIPETPIESTPVR